MLFWVKLSYYKLFQLLHTQKKKIAALKSPCGEKSSF